MKKHKILLMLLLLAILVVSFCGCEEIKLFFASEGTVKDDSQEKTDDLKKTEDPEDDVVKDDEMFCYKMFWNTVTVDSESYEYGEIANISISAQLEECFATLVFVQTYDIHYFTVTLEESPYFEIIGDNSFVFGDFDPREYSYSKENGSVFEASFKIKFNEPDDYAGDAIKIKVDIVARDISTDTVNTYTDDFARVLFIADTQGIIMYPTTYSFNYWAWNAERPSYATYSELFYKSFSRECENGVDAEELIDRFFKTQLGSNGYYLDYTYEEANDCNVLLYATEGVRIKAYFPSDCKFLENKGGVYAAIRELLAIALEHGAITDAEYEVEINRVGRSQYVRLSLDMSYNGDAFVFPNHESDSYYEDVIDLRTGEKT